MSQKSALIIILSIGIGGLLFSGFLSYQELWLNSPVQCGINSKNILGYPACIYGFFMYLIIVIIAILGLIPKAKNNLQIK